MHFPSLSSSQSEHTSFHSFVPTTTQKKPFHSSYTLFSSHCFLSCFLPLFWNGYNEIGKNAPNCRFSRINNSLSITFNSEHNSQWNSPTRPYQHSVNPPVSTFFLCWFAQSSSNCSTKSWSDTTQQPSNRTTQAWTIHWGGSLKGR